MMFPIWAVIWDSTKCDIKHGHDGYFRRDIMVENVAGTFFAKKRRTETIVTKFAR
jgi:hypothetical protein